MDPATGVYAFEYTPEWIARRIELAPLHMPLATKTYEFPELARATFYGLPALLADALPDAFGNSLVNAWMAEQGIAVSDITPLDRLAYAADRAMGALEFAPPARATPTRPPPPSSWPTWCSPPGAPCAGSSATATAPTAASCNS